MAETSRVHSTCKQQMMPVPVTCNLKSSEWYCVGCHKSETMSEETARNFIETREQMQRAAMGGRR